MRFTEFFLGFTGFFLVFFWALLSSTCVYMVLLDNILLDFSKAYLIQLNLPGLTAFYRVSLDVTGFSLVFLAITGFYLVLHSFLRFDKISVNFTRLPIFFYRTESYLVFLDLT